MASKGRCGTDRILRRVRAALADLDGDATISDVDRLDALYEIGYQITGRIWVTEERVNGPSEQTMTKWLPIRY